MTKTFKLKKKQLVESDKSISNVQKKKHDSARFNVTTKHGIAPKTASETVHGSLVSYFHYPKQNKTVTLITRESGKSETTIGPYRDTLSEAKHIPTDDQKEYFDQQMGGHLVNAQAYLEKALFELHNFTVKAKNHKLPVSAESRKVIEKNITTTIEWIKDHHKDAHSRLPARYRKPVPPPPQVPVNVRPIPVKKDELKVEPRPISPSKKSYMGRLKAAFKQLKD